MYRLLVLVDHLRVEALALVGLVMIAPLILLLLSAPAGIASAQIPARVETPYSLIDAESQTFIEGGIETPVRGNGPSTGYGHLFYTRPHFLDEDLSLRLVIPPGYFISELVKDHWPSQNSAVGVGVSGGFFSESQTEFQNGRYETDELFTRSSRRGRSTSRSRASGCSRAVSSTSSTRSPTRTSDT